MLVYLDTSAVLRAVLEGGTTPELEKRLQAATQLHTSRLSLVESSRVLLRLRADGRVEESNLADMERSLGAIWRRCDIWELTASVCDLAQTVSPRLPLRSLDALHLATFLTVRRHLGSEVELLSADKRLLDAAYRL